MVPIRVCSFGSTTIVRLVPIAFGLPGQFSADAVAMPPQSAKEAATTTASLFSPELISSPVIAPIHYGIGVPVAVSASGVRSTRFWPFQSIFPPVQPFGNRFTPAERRLILGLRTPAKVQRWLNRLPYNGERHGETLRSFRQVVRHRTAHCLEAALFAACALE